MQKRPQYPVDCLAHSCFLFHKEQIPKVAQLIANCLIFYGIVCGHLHLFSISYAPKRSHNWASARSHPSFVLFLKVGYCSLLSTDLFIWCSTPLVEGHEKRDALSKIFIWMTLNRPHIPMVSVPNKPGGILVEPGRICSMNIQRSQGHVMYDVKNDWLWLVSSFWLL